MKKIFKFLISILVGLCCFGTFLYFTISANYNNGKEITKSFQDKLQASQYYFIGIVESVQEIEREGGFLCMKLVEFNNDSDTLLFDDIVVSQVDESGHIKHIGSIIFTKLDSNEVIHVQFGDVIQYNVDNNLKYEVYRNNELIAKFDATIGKSNFENKLLDFECF